VSLSILMAVKNGAQFLENSLTQIKKNISLGDEVIIVNDGSVDSTIKILEKWRRKIENLRILDSRGLGLVYSLNLGIREASNEWIARFDVDDNYSDNRLAEQRTLIEDNVAAIFCDYNFFDYSNKSLGFIPSGILPSATALSLVSSQRTPHPGVIFSKTAACAAGLYRPEDFPAEDISLWLRMAKEGHLISTPKRLLNYRINPNSISSNNRKEAISKKNFLLLNIGINKKYFIDCLDNYKSIFEYYDFTSDSFERKILLVRYLRIYKKLFRQDVNSSQPLSEIVVSLLSDIHTHKAYFRLLKGQIARKISRAIN